VVCEASRYGVERKAVYRTEDKIVVSNADELTLAGMVEATTNQEKLGIYRQSEPHHLSGYLPDDWTVDGPSREVRRVTADRLATLGYR